jgi:hypothetical protein
LYVNTVLGASTQKFIAVQNPAATNRYYKPNSNPLTNAFAYPTHNWNAFYLFQFRLNEEKAGISFTGDVRGFLLPDSKPVISLSLSKKINIVNLYNSIANASGSK